MFPAWRHLAVMSGANAEYDKPTYKFLIWGLAIAVLIASLPFIDPHIISQSEDLGFFWPLLPILVLLRIAVGLVALWRIEPPTRQARLRMLWKSKWLSDQILMDQHTSCLVVGAAKLSFTLAATLCFALGGLSLLFRISVGKPLIASFVLVSSSYLFAQLVGGIWLLTREVQIEAVRRTS